MLQIDVNVLVNAARKDAPRHDLYREWLLRLARGPEPFAVTDLVLSGFVRVMMSPAMSRQAGLEMGQVLDFASRIRSRPNCIVVSPGQDHWRIFTSLCRLPGITGRLVADAYHAATAIEYGHDWVSDDTDFARFPDLQWRRPLAELEG